MGRGKHCSAEKREVIKKLIMEGKSYRQVGQLVGCSNKMIRNAITYKEKAERRGRKRALTPLLVKRLIRESKKYPFKAATEPKKGLNITATVQTVRTCLREHNLKACSPRKVPLLKAKHISKRIKFAKEKLQWSVEWRNILWTDESKVVMFGGKGSRSYVRRPQNSEYNPKYTTKTIKHGGSSVMIWACFSYYGVGPIHWIKNIMDQHVYVDILDTVMLPYARDKMPLTWVFQQDNDPKHTSKKAKQWFERNSVNVLEWPAQSPDLNPIENLWTDVKKAVAVSKPTTRESLWKVIQESWYNIALKRCQDLVESMPKLCAAVIANKGNSTKY